MRNFELPVLFFISILVIGQYFFVNVNAHIFTDTEGAVSKNIDRYKVTFLPSPVFPIANDTNTKLNFSIVENNSDVTGVFAAVAIKEKDTGNIIMQFPYRFYEFADISFPFTFTKNNNYIVSLQARINGDPTYYTTPLSADFEVTTSDKNIIFNEAMAYISIILALIIVITFLFFDFRRKKSLNKSEI
jgi:hypothetical protein